MMERSAPWRGVGLALALFLATAFLARWLDETYPLEDWLFFLYARIWLWVALFAAACLASGLRLTQSILVEPQRLGERVVIASALGVLAFFWGVFVAGIIGILGRFFFFAWPLALIAFGAPTAWNTGQREWRLSRFGPRPWSPRGPLSALAALFLAVGIVAVYLQVLTPLNVSGDAVWYHLPVAEHYAAAGKIRPFVEGWYLGAYPQLASILYTWAFLSPGTLFDRVALSSHLEFALFLATVGGVSVLARRLVGRRLSYASAVFFTFPGFLLYDSNLNSGADHVVAFWAPAMGVAFLRLARSFRWREALLAGLMTAGALLTKYQGVYFLPPAAALVLGLAARHRDIRPLGAFAAAGVVATSAHWLKNWIFYADPLYPLLHRWFPSRPFHPGAAKLLQEVYWAPQFLLQGPTSKRIVETLKALFNFSFVPHDWGFHGERPTFGSLFTLLLVALPFVRARLRLWLFIGGIHLAIAVWFWISHQDRFLQALLPWMAAATAALLALVWQSGWLARAAATALVSLQVVSGGDIYFLRVHNMIGDSPLKALVDYLSAGHTGRYDERFRLWGSLQDLGRKVPQGAKVLGHEWNEKLGMQSQSIADGPGWQGGIDYLALSSPEKTFAFWKELGATHTWWLPSRPGMSPDALAREAVYQRTVFEHVGPTEDFGIYRFGALGAREPDAHDADPTRIAWIGCGGDPATGIYSPGQLSERKAPESPGLPGFGTNPSAALRDANALVHRPSCGAPGDAFQAVLDGEFTVAVKAEGVTLFVRKPAP